MLVVYAKCVVSAQNTERFLSFAKELVEETRKESGNISYELIKEKGDRSLYAFLEKWSDKEALDTHMITEHFTRLIPEIKRLVIGDIDIIIHELIV